MGGQSFPVSFNHILQIFTQESELSFVFLPQAHKVTEPEQHQSKQPSHLAWLPRPPSVWFLGVSSQREIPRQEEKGLTEDEMVGWHHRLNGHEFEQTLVIVKDREAWRVAVHGLANSRTRLRD